MEPIINMMPVQRTNQTYHGPIRRDVRGVRSGRSVESFPSNFSFNPTADQFFDAMRSQPELTPEQRLCEALLQQSLDDYRDVIDHGSVANDHSGRHDFNAEDRDDLENWFWEDDYGRDDETFLSFALVCKSLAIEPTGLRSAVTKMFGSRAALHAVPLVSNRQTWESRLAA